VNTHTHIHAGALQH